MTDLLKQMEEDAAQPEALSDGDLKLVTVLAERQLTLLGNGISKGPTGAAIQGLRDWAKMQKVEADAALTDYSIASLIGALVERLASYREISEVKLPAAMQAVGLTEFKLANGYTVTIADDIRAAVKAGMWPEITAWLKEHGLEGIMKSEVKMNFDLDDTGMNLETDIGQALLGLAIKHGIIHLNANGLMQIPDEEEPLLSIWCVPKLTRSEAILTLAKEEGIVGEENCSINAATLKAVVKVEKAKGVEFPENLFSIQEAKKALVVPAKVAKLKAVKEK